jgi:SAM-dependent methyltransferase
VGGTESTNYAKFQTGNPIVRRLIERFYARVLAMTQPLGAESLLDAGCGEGETLARLGPQLPRRTVAVDLDADAVAFTSERLPGVEVSRCSLTDLPFDDASFDLVLCLEVLEHLPDPGAGLRELARVATSDIVVSVPHEPWFRLGSLLRGKYLSGLGNHPEHVNHWNPTSFRRFLASEFDQVSVERSLPWVIAHCRAPRRLGPRSARPATG